MINRSKQIKHIRNSLYKELALTISMIYVAVISAIRVMSPTPDFYALTAGVLTVLSIPRHAEALYTWVKIYRGLDRVKPKR